MSLHLLGYAQISCPFLKVNRKCHLLAYKRPPSQGDCCSPRWRSFIYEAYSILSGLSREAAFQPMFHQFRSVAARFAEPTADNGTDQGHSPSPFQSGCRSRRWPARHRAYWQRANFCGYALKHISGIMSSSHLCAVKSKI